jgi:carbamoyltransferase
MSLRDCLGRARPGTPLTDRERDIAASLQLRLEEVGFHVLNHLHEQTGLTDLGLAGGVAYNSVMNGKILLNTPFARLRSAGGGRQRHGARCLLSDLQRRAETRARRSDEGAYTGPEFSNEEIRAALEREDWLLKFTAMKSNETRGAGHRGGFGVGWFQGRMEFGPRALGNRSIVVDPRRAEMKDILNDRIKKREPFRPFAPSILEERVGDYFEQTHPAPTMLMVYQIKEERAARFRR